MEISDEFIRRVLTGTPLEEADEDDLLGVQKASEPAVATATPSNAIAVEAGPVATEATKKEEPVCNADTLKSLVSKEQIESSGKVKVAVIRRLIVLILTLVNQALVVLGFYSAVPINEGVIEIVSLVLVVAAALYCYWQNNSWSSEASICDNILQALQSGDIDISDILEIFADVSKKNTDTTTINDN